MSSTRNKNTIGNYQLEHNSFVNHKNYMVTNPIQENPTHFCGNGLIGQKCPSSQLSNNSIDVESFLFGINSTNLEGPSFEARPELKTLKSLSIQDRVPFIMPEPLYVASNQRPFPR